MVGHCQAEARRIMWDLRDSDEITEILSHALSRSLTANCLREGIDTSFEVDGCEVPIAPAAVHHLVSIAQEAVLNAIRHSGATQILVTLKYESDSLRLRIRDNGCGFYYDKVHISPGHFGILVMEGRARNLGGALRVNTALGAGTEIVLTADFRGIHPPSDREQRVLHWIGV
jgi:signal transduction histidine kinase